MAADAKLLLDTLLRANSSAFHLLLESAEHSQALQDKAAAREWITKINSLLDLSHERWMGVCLLNCLIKQCSTDVFLENCLSWLRTLARILQQEKQNVNLCKYVADILEWMLSLSIQFSELSREISSVIPSLLTAMLNEKALSYEVSLLVIKSCIQYYPGPCGSFWKRIETLLLEIFNTDNLLLNQIACSCFAILPKCGNPTGSGVDKQTASWEMQWRKILSALSAVIDELYSNHEKESAFKINFAALDLNAVPVVEPKRTETCVFRIKCMLKCLDLMLRNGFSKSVNIPMDSTVKLLLRILAVNEKSIINHVAIESVLLKFCLPAIHVSALNCLSTFIESCQMSLLPYHRNITKMFLLELSWSTSDTKTAGFVQKFSKLRSAVYECLQRWVHITGSVGEHSDIIKKFVYHLIDDVKPRVVTTKLLAPTASSSKNVPHGKKAKRKRVQDDISQLTRTQQKTDHFANEDLCTSGLKALKLIILKASNDIPPEAIKDVQSFVVNLLLECQQVSSSTPHCSYPIPYGSPQCRILLYQLLQCLLYNHNLAGPPPVQHAIRIFSQGVQDRTLEVSKFCTEAQMMCNILIHPRVAVIASSLNLVQEQQTVETQHYRAPEVKLVDGDKESIEMGMVPGVNDVLPYTIDSTNSDDQDTESVSLLILNQAGGEAQNVTASTSVSLLGKESGSNIQNEDIQNPNKELSPELSIERSNTETTSPAVMVAEQRLNEEIHEESDKLIDENLHEDPTKKDQKNVDKNDETLGVILSNSRNRPLSDCQSVPLNGNDDGNGPPVKKRKTGDINRNNLEETNSRDNNSRSDKDHHNTKEITESDEDEELERKMIATFVDSIADSE